MRNLRLYLLCFLTVICRQNLHAQSEGGFTSGAAAYCDSLNSGFISLNGFNGLILYWEQLTDNQPGWQKIQNTTSTQSYNQLKRTTSYRAIVQDGNFPPDTSTVATVTVHIPGPAGTVDGGGTFCSGANQGAVELSGAQGNVLLWQYRETGGSWQNISHTTAILPFTNLISTREYRAIVERVPGCNPDTSSAATIIIDDRTVSGILSESDTICYGAAGDTLVLSGQRGTVLNWLLSTDKGQRWTHLQSGHLTFVYPQTTVMKWYAVTVKNGVCPADTTAPVIIDVFPEVTALAGPDAVITKLESVRLRGEGNGSARWYPAAGLSDTITFSPIASPAETTVYKLVITDQNGCSDIDSVRILVEIPIPTAFTPNNDGVNDNFEIYQIEKFPHNSLKIFNRWGQNVYEAAPYKNEWFGRSSEGTELADDTYFYTFNYGGGEKPVTGYILIKR